MGHAHSLQGIENLKVKVISQGIGLMSVCVVCSTVYNKLSMPYDVLLRQTVAQMKNAYRPVSYRPA